MIQFGLGDRPRILITRADRIGDLIISTSVFPQVRKKFPKAWIACLTNLENREILEGNPYLNEIILYDKKGSEKSFWGNLKLARKIAGKKFDAVIHLHATNRMHLLTWLARIPLRIGWDRRASWALTRSYPEVKKEGRKHEADYNFELLEPFGIMRPQKHETFFPVTEKSQSSLESLLKFHEIPSSDKKQWILLSPGASCPSKRWPAERFAETAQLIAEKNPDAVFIGIGTRADRTLIEKISRNLNAPFYDLSGRLTLGMLGALAKRAALLISNDSGPVHAASAVGTPVLSIFGRNQPGLSPQRWRPLGEKSAVLWKNVECDPCLAHECQIHFLCLDVISAADVSREAEALLIK